MPMSHTARMQVKQAATKLPVTRPQSDILKPTSKNQAHVTSSHLPITNILQDSQSYIIQHQIEPHTDVQVFM